MRFLIPFSLLGAATVASLLLLDRIGEVAAGAIFTGGVLVSVAGRALAVDRTAAPGAGSRSVQIGFPETWLERSHVAGIVAQMSARQGPGWTLEVVGRGTDPDEIEVTARELARLIEAGQLGREVRYVVVARD
ncbi:MAG TPA: hypothetical protein VHG69_01150 [Thermoleophilaceae bacterium]|nr:hypothetical protein [Thermoleophilaceae bacterium]